MSEDRPSDQRVVVDFSVLGLGKVLAAVASVYLLLRLWPVLLVVVVALVLVGTLGPIVGSLERRGLKRGWALTLLFTILLLGLVALSAITLPAIAHQLVEMLERAPQLQERLAAFCDQHTVTAPLAQTIRNFHVQSLWSGDVTGTLKYSVNVLEGLGYAATAIVLAAYLLSGRDEARAALYAWIPRRYHVRSARIVINLETIVGGYVRGQLITSAAIGLFVFGLLSLLRVPNALALAVFAALTDVIPFVGGLLASGPAVLAALSRGLGTAGIVLVVLVVYQEFESRILVPRIYGKALRLSPAAVVLALLVGGELMGILGALLALPIAAGVRMAFEELHVDLPGVEKDHAELLEREEQVAEEYLSRVEGTSPVEAAAVAVKVAEELVEKEVGAERVETGPEKPPDKPPDEPAKSR